jgi:oligopeptide/dipeptide ABC transporter ATP-binding protein
MRALQREINMSIIFITHDLGVIAEMCERVIVMYAGRIAEEAPVKELFRDPRHPYTQGLLASILEGMVPGLKDIPQGCRFRTRCDYSIDACSRRDPPLEIIDGNPSHTAACIRWREISHER